jgi:hypothetical protein
MAEKENAKYGCFVAAFLGTWATHQSGREPNEFMIEAYWRALAAFSAEQIETAFSRAIGQLRFFPKPVELLEFITGGNKDDLEARAQVEASRVASAVGRIGGYCSVTFDDLVTMAVIQYGFDGWEKLTGELKADEHKWFVKDFVKLYQAYARQDVRLTGRLAGIEERINTANGYIDNLSGTVLIGDPQKAAQIAATPPEHNLLQRSSTAVVIGDVLPKILESRPEAAVLEGER